MTRTSRTRTRANPVYTGSQKRYKNGTLVSTLPSSRTLSSDSITDSHGRPVVPSPLSSSQWEGTYPNISGYVKNTPITLYDRADFSSYTLTAVPTYLTALATMGVPAGWTLDLVAGTNPSRPLVTIPELVEDLADLPRMLKALGDHLRNPKNLLHDPNKGIATEYLGIQFGWLPLLEDLHKLLDLQSYVLKRNRELAELYSGRGLRRRLKFDESTEVFAYPANTAVGSTVITTLGCVVVEKKTWATIRWIPSTLPPWHSGDVSQNQYVRRILLGATSEGLMKGLWAVIPWSWLIGWFSNFHKFALANSWAIPATHKDMCFMSYAKATWYAGGATVSNSLGDDIKSEGKLSRTLKTRVVSSTVSSSGFNMPYLDMFRLSILGSLFVQKFGRQLPFD